MALSLQLAQAVSLISYRGNGFSPSMVKLTRDPTTGVSTPRKGAAWPTIQERPTSWDRVIEGMTDVVMGERGTARASGYGAKYAFAGKTGTAQVFSVALGERYKEADVTMELRDHGLFIAFAPVDVPRIAIAVVVENGGGGARAAAPVARKVFDAWLDAAGAAAPVAESLPAGPAVPAPTPTTGPEGD